MARAANDIILNYLNTSDGEVDVETFMGGKIFNEMLLLFKNIKDLVTDARQILGLLQIFLNPYMQERKQSESVEGNPCESLHYRNAKLEQLTTILNYYKNEVLLLHKEKAQKIQAKQRRLLNSSEMEEISLNIKRDCEKILLDDSLGLLPSYYSM